MAYDLSNELFNSCSFILFHFSFDISKGGAHAGAVVFSDHRQYSRLTIRFNDHFSVADFNNAIDNSPFFGFRTRIDYAFKIATEQLFVHSGGKGTEVWFLIMNCRCLTCGYTNVETRFEGFQITELERVVL